MRVGSLFSGIGGLDLGLERAGMTVAWQSEIDPYASKVLAKHWPDVPNLGDITTIDWSTVEPVDLICGGYPCQPFSLAGARAGSNDARHLWPYFADALRELRPRWALLENVPGHLSMGFGSVLSDLADLGYNTDWDCIPAAAVGAPHLRYRVFVVAHTSSPRRRQDTRGASGDEGQDEGRPSLHDHVVDGDGEGGRARDVAYAEGVTVGTRLCEGRQGRQWRGRLGDSRGEIGELADAGCISTGSQSQPERAPSNPSGPSRWAVEPDVGRVAYGVPSRVDRLKCLGNAVVPQVAEWVGRRIVSADRDNRSAQRPVGVADETLCGVSDEIGQIFGELCPVAGGCDGDGEGVVHLQDNDKPAQNVKRQSA